MEQQIVSITLKSKFVQDNQKDEIKKKYTGKMIFKDNFWYVRYTDKLFGAITVKYHVNDNTVTILYANHAVKKMVFDKKNDTQTRYQLPQGQLLFMIHTQEIQSDVKENKLRALNINYQLIQDDQLFGEYMIHYKLR